MVVTERKKDDLFGIWLLVSGYLLLVLGRIIRFPQ